MDAFTRTSLFNSGSFQLTMLRCARAHRRASAAACSSHWSSVVVTRKERVTNTVFRFKHFDLNHGKCAQKMGTDSMLLGSWTEPPSKCKTVLDVGTGTGVLALMMAQKTQQQCSFIHAIDIDQDSYTQASENFIQSPWAERLIAAHTSFQDWASQCSAKYDMIITNPPYFLQSSKPDVSSRAAARHADVLLPFCDLAAGAAALLQPTGRLCLILPAGEAQQFAAVAQQHGLQLTHLMKVFTKCQDVEPRRHLMQFELAAGSDPAGSQNSGSNADTTAKAVAQEQLVVMEQQINPVTGKSVHAYSKQYQLLTDDFHHPSMFQRG